MGGHGGLNILPQKKWNVYREDNKAKVRQDEEKHAEEEAARRKRQLLRDAEVRRKTLLERAILGKGEGGASGSQGSVQDAVSQLTEAAPRNINFFEDLEEVSDGLAHKNSKALDLRDGKSKEEDIKFSLAYGAGRKGDEPWYARRAQAYAPDEGSNGNDISKKRPTVESQGQSAKRRKTTEELRQERSQREQLERQKASNLLMSKASTATSGAANVTVGSGLFKVPPVRQPRYHSGFGFGR